MLIVQPNLFLFAIRFFTIADYEEEEIWLHNQHKSGWKLVNMFPPCFFYFEKCMPLGIVMDERLCTGVYMALALRQFKRYLANPVSLEEKPDSASVIKEIPYRKDIK